MRAAGDSGYYEVYVVDALGQPVGKPALLPSVTYVLKALPKGGLDWYGYKMGLVEGRKLAQQATVVDSSTSTPALDDDAFYEEAKRLGREGKVITPSNALKKAANRGTDVHDLAETLLKTGKLPPKNKVPVEKHGYAEALLNWYDEKVVGDKAFKEVIAVEVPVFSMQYQYAGTLDFILKYGDPAQGTYYVVGDFKTSKGIYESHLLQATAYNFAARERGYIPFDAATISNVVRLGVDGEYEQKTSWCELEDFMHVYRVWQWLESMKG